MRQFWISSLSRRPNKCGMTCSVIQSDRSESIQFHVLSWIDKRPDCLLAHYSLSPNMWSAASLLAKKGRKPRRVAVLPTSEAMKDYNRMVVILHTGVRRRRMGVTIGGHSGSYHASGDGIPGASNALGHLLKSGETRREQWISPVSLLYRAESESGHTLEYNRLGCYRRSQARFRAELSMNTHRPSGRE